MPGYGDEDIERPVMLTTVRTSRSHRTCATCGGDIRPGQQYARIFFPPGDHGPATFAAHASAATSRATRPSAPAPTVSSANAWSPRSARVTKA